MQDGSYTWIEDRGYVLARNADGSVARMVGAHRSIEDKKRLLEALERRNQSLEAIVEERTRELSRVNQQLQIQLEENRKLAETDALTSIANRYRLEKALPQACERAQRFRQPLSLIAMDIDDFKNINDHYGHALGDAALVQVVESVKRCVREGDLLARWGGDEFIMVLPNTPLADARTLAENIRAWPRQLAARRGLSSDHEFWRGSALRRRTADRTAGQGRSGAVSVEDRGQERDFRVSYARALTSPPSPIPVSPDTDPDTAASTAPLSADR